MTCENILLVDDEIHFIEIASRRLSKRGFSVATAISGQEALEWIEKNPHVEVVVLDIKMPGMDGLETLTEIKRRHPQIQVIILTSQAAVEPAIEGMKRGAFDYMTKPFELEELILKIRQESS